MLSNFIIAWLLASLLFANTLSTIQQKEADIAQRIGAVHQDVKDFPKKKDVNNLGLITASKAVLVVDQKTNKYLIAKQERTKLPIASITKLMSLLVLLDYNIDWEAEVEYKKEYAREGSNIIMRPLEKFRAKDLFYSALIASANNAVAALVAATGITEKEFVQKMNEKAKALGMIDTYFFEPTGLSEHNQSTASDLVLLMQAVLQKKEIVDALNAPDYKFEMINTKNSQKIFNNNYLLDSFINQGDYQLLAGKTGHTVEAGYCLLMAVRKDNEVIFVAVLGGQSEDQRFQEAKSLAYWAFENYIFSKQ